VARHEQSQTRHWDGPRNSGRGTGSPRALDHRYTAQERHQDHWISFSELSSEDIDITIVSLSPQESQTATLPLAATADDSVAERTTKLVQKHLKAVAREKRSRHPPSGRPFRPFVLSLGGTMETDARDALKLWKTIMTGGVYSLLVRRLSLGLLRARAGCFEP
jgi:hypothetical protein